MAKDKDVLLSSNPLNLDSARKAVFDWIEVVIRIVRLTTSWLANLDSAWKAVFDWMEMMIRIVRLTSPWLRIDAFSSSNLLNLDSTWKSVLAWMEVMIRIVRLNLAGILIIQDLIAKDKDESVTARKLLGCKVPANDCYGPMTSLWGHQASNTLQLWMALGLKL